jgi:hypothetical protein
MQFLITAKKRGNLFVFSEIWSGKDDQHDDQFEGSQKAENSGEGSSPHFWNLPKRIGSSRYVSGTYFITRLIHWKLLNVITVSVII